MLIFPAIDLYDGKAVRLFSRNKPRRFHGVKQNFKLGYVKVGIDEIISAAVSHSDLDQVVSVFRQNFKIVVKRLSLRLYPLGIESLGYIGQRERMRLVAFCFEYFYKF